jgi:hypothetical protein
MKVKIETNDPIRSNKAISMQITHFLTGRIETKVFYLKVGEYFTIPTDESDTIFKLDAFDGSCAICSFDNYKTIRFKNSMDIRKLLCH